MSSRDGSESQGLAADELQGCTGKNQTGQGSLGLPDSLPSSTGAEKTALNWVNADAVRSIPWCISHQQHGKEGNRSGISGEML